MTLLDSYRPDPPPPCDVEAERMLIGNVMSGYLELGVLDDISVSDLWVPLHQWVLTQIRAGATTLHDLIECAQNEGVLRAVPALEELYCEPLMLWPPIKTRVENIVKQAKKRRAIALLDACKLAVLEDDEEALEAAMIRLSGIVPEPIRISELATTAAESI